jgi:hypothetical protein
MTGDDEPTIDRKQQLADFIDSDYATVSRYRIIANSPDRSPEERRDAVAAIQGHLLRIQMLEEQLAQCATAEARANQTEPGRKARLDKKERRDSIGIASLRANPTMPMKQLLHEANQELEKHNAETGDDLEPFSDSHLYDLKKIP